MIDYQQIGRAIKFYSDHGWKDVEMPWVVDEVSMKAREVSFISRSSVRLRVRMPAPIVSVPLMTSHGRTSYIMKVSSALICSYPPVEPSQ